MRCCLLLHFPLSRRSDIRIWSVYFRDNRWQREKGVKLGAIMGLAYNIYLNSSKIFGCKACKTHLADYNDIVSRVRLSLSLYLSISPVVIVRTPHQLTSIICCSGLPRSTWQSVSLQLRGQHHPIRRRRTEHDNRSTCGSRHYVPAMQGDSRLEIR